jgi:hypothetical protein
VHLRKDGKVVFRLKRTFRNGFSQLLFSVEDLRDLEGCGRMVAEAGERPSV